MPLRVPGGLYLKLTAQSSRYSAILGSFERRKNLKNISEKDRARTSVLIQKNNDTGMNHSIDQKAMKNFAPSQ